MRGLAFLLSLVLLVAACSEARPLLDERSAQPYANWAHVRGEGHRRSVERIEAQAPGEERLMLRVVHLQCARPADPRLLVLQPGVLADHTTWRFLAPLLAERNDVLLVDPPGTGGSDAPDPDRHPAPAYTPEWIGAHTLRAVENWQRRRGDVRGIVLVGHSLGSAAIVRVLTDPASAAELADVRARVDGVVLVAHPDVLMEDVPQSLERVAELSDLEVGAAVALGILDAEMADAVHGGVADPGTRALRQEAERLAGMIRAARTRRPAQAMLRRFRPLEPDGSLRRAEAQAIADRARTLSVPVLLIWGVQDDTLPHAMADLIAARLPRVERLDIADAKHSAHQERADICAWRIARFLSDHPARR